MNGSRILTKFGGKIRRIVRLRGPLVNDPTAKVLHSLVVGALVFSLSGLIVVPFIAPNKPVSGGEYLELVITLIAVWALLQRGFLRMASFTYLGGTWLLAAFIVVTSGGAHAPAQVLLVALPISAAWLLGFNGALFWAVICVGTSLTVAVVEAMGGRLPLYTPGRPMGLWIVPLLATVVVTVPTAQVLRILKQALAASIRDIAERTRAEKELRSYQEHLEELVEQRTRELVQARDQAESANRAKSTFLANMSHELRTPLSVILAFSDLLGESDPTPDQGEAITAIGRSGQHLLGLIDDVLDVAKIEAGKEELAIAANDLISTVRTVVEMMRGRAEEKDLALIYEQALKVPRYVRVDAPKLRQILINLLGNAIKFTQEGTVKLRLSAQPADEPGRARLCFDIEDSGVGMPQHDLGRIFEPFERVRNAEPQKGTGLGLTITRRFVELMGGTLLVESEVGRGSRFVVELPLELAEESETYDSESATGHTFILESGQPEWRVLIVEDDPESATVLRKMITRAGFHVRVAENGALGIEAFQQWRPHFIWMDLGMPQLTGTEAKRRIRQLDGGAEVKIAALTASANASERHGVMRAGFDDCIFKPFRRTEIFFCMARHLGVRYSSSEEAGNKSHRQAGVRSA